MVDKLRATVLSNKHHTLSASSEQVIVVSQSTGNLIPIFADYSLTERLSNPAPISALGLFEAFYDDATYTDVVAVINEFVGDSFTPVPPYIETELLFEDFSDTTVIPELTIPTGPTAGGKLSRDIVNGAYQLSLASTSGATFNAGINSGLASASSGFYIEVGISTNVDGEFGEIRPIGGLASDDRANIIRSINVRSNSGSEFLGHAAELFNETSPVSGVYKAYFFNNGASTKYTLLKDGVVIDTRDEASDFNLPPDTLTFDISASPEFEAPVAGGNVNLNVDFIRMGSIAE